jgi:hypothetical protein
MAKITKGFSMTVKERRYRRFSESFKREKVKEIIENRSTVSDICRVNEVFYTAIYHWINLYSNPCCAKDISLARVYFGFYPKIYKTLQTSNSLF